MSERDACTKSAQRGRGGRDESGDISSADRSEGISALVEALGPVGMARFLQQFDIGSGDYTKERERWFRKITLDDALREIKRRRESKNDV